MISWMNEVAAAAQITTYDALVKKARKTLQSAIARLYEKNAEIATRICEENVEKWPLFLEYIPDKCKTLDICKNAVEKNPLCLEFVPNQFKTQEMCERAVDQWPWRLLKYVPVHLMTEDMCSKAVGQCPQCLKYVPVHLMTQEMCSKAMENDPKCLEFVPDWFITHAMMLKYDNEPCVKAYKERKALKKQIWDELIPVAWHPSRAWDWCFDEDQKQDMSWGVE